MRMPADEGKRPAEVAAEFWPDAEEGSKSRGARVIQEIARDIFPTAPGSGGAWYFSPADIERLRAEIDPSRPRRRPQ